MCKCTPSIRTPYCGKKGCEWPNSKPEGTRSDHIDNLHAVDTNEAQRIADEVCSRHYTHRRHYAEIYGGVMAGLAHSIGEIKTLRAELDAANESAKHAWASCRAASKQEDKQYQEKIALKAQVEGCRKALQKAMIEVEDKISKQGFTTQWDHLLQLELTDALKEIDHESVCKT